MGTQQQNPFSAFGSVLGYLYQCRLALLLFLQRWKTNPDTDAAIEKFDDVSFEACGDPRERIQTKHHISASGKLTDTSHDLWGTLRVWCTLVWDKGVRLPGTTFFLITTSTAPSGSGAQRLQDGPNRDSQGALVALTQVAQASLEPSNLKAYQKFLSLTEDRRRALLEAVFVVDQAPNIEDVRRQIEREVSPTLRPAEVPLYVDRLEAWWFARVIRHLCGGGFRAVLGTELNAQMADIRDQFRSDNLPIDFAAIDPPPERETALASNPFVQQLRLIALSDSRIKHAITDYYRAFEQRSRWVREELLHVGELRQYEKRLVEEWRRRFERMREELPSPASEESKIGAGRSVYNWAEDTETPIRPACTEPFISRGSFQMLADELRVGWHPEFERRLKALLAEVEA